MMKALERRAWQKQAVTMWRSERLSLRCLYFNVSHVAVQHLCAVDACRVDRGSGGSTADQVLLACLRRDASCCCCWQWCTCNGFGVVAVCHPDVVVQFAALTRHAAAAAGSDTGIALMVLWWQSTFYNQQVSCIVF